MEHSLREPYRIAQSLIDAPLYAITLHSDDLTAAERRYIYNQKQRGVLAFTSPANDQMFRKGALRYRWQGRGCCVALCESPYNLSEIECLGLLLHEVGHYLADADHPARKEPDHAKALETEWANMRPDEEIHNRQWLRATVHLWHRTTIRLEGGLPFDNVVNLEQYGYGRSDLLPLLDEASQREDEPIEAILKDSGAVPGSGDSRPLTGTAPRESNRQRMERFGLPQPFSGWIGGQVFECSYGRAYLDGEEIPLDSASRLYARYRSGELDGRAPRQYGEDDPRHDLRQVA